MKFYLLPIGEKFSYQGTEYTKSGPLTASNNANGESKMIPRSANIQSSVEIKTDKTESPEQGELSVSDVINVINIFYQDASDNLKEMQAELSSAGYKRAKIQLDSIYKKALNSLVVK